MRPTARELLAEAAASGEDLETVARGLLAKLAELTGHKTFPKSSVARLLEIRTFASYPVFAADGKFFGTLCGASKGEVLIEHEILELMRECARLLGQRVRSEPRTGKQPSS